MCWCCSSDATILAALCPDTCQVISWIARSRTYTQDGQAEAHSCGFGGGHNERLAVSSAAACCLWAPGQRGELIKSEADIQVGGSLTNCVLKSRSAWTSLICLVRNSKGFCRYCVDPATQNSKHNQHLHPSADDRRARHNPCDAWRMIIWG